MPRPASSRYLLNFSLLTVSAALFVGACSDDTEDGGDGPVAGASGSPDSGGTAGSGGSVGNGGSAGTPGLGGTSGSGGAAGSAGSGSNLAGEGGGGASSGGAPVSGGEAGNGGTPDQAGSGGDGGQGGAADDLLPRSTPQELATESAADYASNKHGLITGSTLKPWVENWTANRPQGVTGKLVVLQIGSSAATSLVHVQEAGSNVVSYLVATGELTQVRDNGLSSIEAEIPNGAAADAFLKKYGIDVTKDFVVLTFEQLPAAGQTAATANSIVQSVGRAWLLLTYWGYPKERIAILNGSVNWNATNQALPLATTAAVTPPNNGTSSVRDLRVDNTALVVTLSELLTILKDQSEEYPRDEVTVVDARGGAEALGLLKATSTGKTNCGAAGNARYSPPFEGRIKGAHSVPWPELLTNAADGFRFPAKATVKATFDALSAYEAGNVTIQYCRTNMRSMVTGIAASVILGYPTRFYDTSFIEWSHLSYGPTPRTQVLPQASLYRTDLPSLTEHATLGGGYVPGGTFDPLVHTVTGWVNGPNYNADVDISADPIAVVLTATSTNLSVEQDRAYKL